MENNVNIKCPYCQQIKVLPNDCKIEYKCSNCKKELEYDGTAKEETVAKKSSSSWIFTIIIALVIYYFIRPYIIKEDSPTKNNDKTLPAVTANTTNVNSIEIQKNTKNQAHKTKIPLPPNDNASDFDEYTVKMLISKEYIEHESADIWYGEYHFLTGIITEVEKNLSSIKIHVIKTSSSFKKDFRSIDGEDWTVGLDQTVWSSDNEMSRSASINLPALLVPGRRLKFAMVEGYPGCGTVMNGVWFLTYAKALDGSAF